MEILDVFNDANEKRELKYRIDFKEFYNDAINRDVHITDHLLVWNKERDNAKKENRPVNRTKVFSLCFYPWIFDTGNKSDILKQEIKI